ncbi:EcsC family protein [Crenobacter caeni]|uniref:EcsC family protein n=1 Tax=Crenobacter caeni TaxID=2705474 RepID=A0A6B2KSD5_9NEIS|nr:EcsC family protein [Crenobacter caeni]NDV12991.1 EcsC family protein [Crenobacter caeni]
MTELFSEEKIIKALDWTYEKVLNGIPGLDSAEELARSYLKLEGDLHDKANSLIRWQNTKAGTSGFINGLGGAPLMPVTVPANITSVMYVQVRMIVAIAHIGGHDIRDDRVRALVYACLCGNAAKDIIKEVGIKIGAKLTEQAIRGISKQAIVKINQVVGFRLLTKFGQTGAVNLGKAIPLVGGVIGATFDSVTTNAIGNIARDTFIPTRV